MKDAGAWRPRFFVWSVLPQSCLLRVALSLLRVALLRSAILSASVIGASYWMPSASVCFGSEMSKNKFSSIPSLADPCSCDSRLIWLWRYFVALGP